MTVAGTEPGVVRPSRQIAIGVGLLVGGGALAAALIEAGTNVLASVGIVLALSGLVLLGNGLLLSRRGEQLRDAAPPDDGFDTPGAVALVLAVLVPPVGVLVAAYAPVRHRRGAALRTAALAVGAISTVLGTLLAVLFAALARTGG